jgi:hypothetical protein
MTIAVERISATGGEPTSRMLLRPALAINDVFA